MGYATTFLKLAYSPPVNTAIGAGVGGLIGGGIGMLGGPMLSAAGAGLGAGIGGGMGLMWNKSQDDYVHDTNMLYSHPDSAPAVHEIAHMWKNAPWHGYIDTSEVFNKYPHFNGHNNMMMVAQAEGFRVAHGY